MGLQDIINEIKSARWEERSQIEIDTMRVTVAAFKSAMPLSVPVLKEVLREQLVGSGGHARDSLAVRLFNHYLDAHGRRFDLTINDVRMMAAATAPVPGPIDIRRTAWTSTAMNLNWATKVALARSTSSPQNYSGSLLWAWDNGAIANYTINYVGQIRILTSGAVQWAGYVEFIDRFDLDPRWGWSTATPGGRSRGGERRTRIGYILDLGTDFDIRGPKALATQTTPTNYIVLLGGVMPVGSGGSAGDI